MDNLYLSRSLNHLRHQKTPYFTKQKAVNHNRSQSPAHPNEKISTKNIHSSSSKSLNSYLKEFNLTQKDLNELQQALRTIFCYIQSKPIHNHSELLKQRLRTPYLKQKQNNDDELLLPLYTNEHFIRNGLLNHNNGPQIHYNHSKSNNYSKTYPSSYCSSLLSSNSTMLTSSVNISLPLALLSNQKYLFSALTSNFTLDEDNNNETKSMIIRRNKVQAWERENSQQQKASLTYSSSQTNVQLQASDYHQNIINQTQSIIKDDKIMKITEDLITDKNISLNISDDGKKTLLENKNTDDLFPMVKSLGRE